jgi:hypothetical protein
LNWVGDPVEDDPSNVQSKFAPPLLILHVLPLPVGPVTVNLAASPGCSARDTCRDAPPDDPVIVTFVTLETLLVVTVKFAVVEPCPTLTLPGTCAAALSLDNDTAAPLPVAAPDSVTVPCTDVPPTTDEDASDTLDNVGSGVTGPPPLLVLLQPAKSSPTPMTAIAATTEPVKVRIDIAVLLAPPGMDILPVRRSQTRPES